MLYEATSQREARLSDFIGLNGEWRWSRVSMEFIDLWDRVQDVCLCPSVGHMWVWVLGR